MPPPPPQARGLARILQQLPDGYALLFGQAQLGEPQPQHLPAAA
ncbi:hypothetical protein ABZZ17_24745 [Streptomyces sp. NPDC006512]